MRAGLARISCVASVLALTGAHALASVTILGQPTSYATIQAAVDAAVDGDILVVEPGNYAGFAIDNKALSVIALPGSSVSVSSRCRVENLAAKKTVVLSGLEVTGHSSGGSTIPALELTNDAGHVRIQSCSFEGGVLGSPVAPASSPGVLATSCARVVFTQCTLLGRDAAATGGEPGIPGGDGLIATESTIALYDCTLKGGKGSNEGNPSGGRGGRGALFTGFGLFSSGSSITGGRGGEGDQYTGCTTSGDGGVGLVLDEAQAQLLDTSIAGGPKGFSGTCGVGSDGEHIVNVDGIVNVLSGTRRKLTGPAQASDGTTVQFVVTGEPDDSFWLIRAQRPAFRFMRALNGVVAVPYPWLVPIAQMGTVGAGGTLNVNLPIGDLSASQFWFMQGLCVDSAGGSILTSPLQLLVVSP